MLKYSLYTIKNKAAKKKSYIQLIKVVSRKITTSKIDDIIYHEGAHTQQDFRQQNLKPDWELASSTCICHNSCSLIILKYKNVVLYPIP